MLGRCQAAKLVIRKSKNINNFNRYGWLIPSAMVVKTKKFLKWREKMANRNNNGSDLFEESSEEANLLWQYVQSMSPDTVSHLSKPTSQEVFQVMERNIVGLLGNIPSEQFNVNVTTSRENLGKLLASAMISGYFLRNAEQRMTFEKYFKVNQMFNNES